MQALAPILALVVRREIAFGFAFEELVEIPWRGLRQASLCVPRPLSLFWIWNRATGKVKAEHLRERVA